MHSRALHFKKQGLILRNNNQVLKRLNSSTKQKGFEFHYISISKPPDELYGHCLIYLFKRVQINYFSFNGWKFFQDLIVSNIFILEIVNQQRFSCFCSPLQTLILQNVNIVNYYWELFKKEFHIKTKFLNIKIINNTKKLITT